jgi:hypothetical protein
VGYRVSRRYSWREIQELARDLQTLCKEVTQQNNIPDEYDVAQSSSSMSDPRHSGSNSRIIRVERMRTERERVRSERASSEIRETPLASQTIKSHKLSFNPQEFKAAWSAKQQRASYPPLTEAEPHPSPSYLSSDAQILEESSHSGSTSGSRSASINQSHLDQPTSPWELLKDHFLAQHRLHKKHQEEREAVEDIDHKVDP